MKNLLAPQQIAEHLGLDAPYAAVPGRWSADKANAWYAEQGWLAGTNFYPSTAINQIEMWQASTWDRETIDRELGYSADLGFNTHRVYLHDMVWADDEQGLYERMDQFLTLCDKHGIKPFFVFFDDCHYPTAELGVQPEPVPCYHNSGWVTCPQRPVAVRFSQGQADPDEVAQLKGYVQETMRRFADDSRVLMWELYNEPGRGPAEVSSESGNLENEGFGDASAKLIQAAWTWAREVNPSQPICGNTEGCVGQVNWSLNFLNSDVQSIHCYTGPDGVEELIGQFQQDGRPIFMTEYLARRTGSTFQAVMPILKKHNVAAINWGFASGKAGTIWPWHSRNRDGVFCDAMTLRAQGEILKPGEPFPEPDLWFHDVVRADGTPYDQEEAAVIRRLTQTEAME